MSHDVWVPVYESLFLDDKDGLAHSTRSIFVWLCLRAYRRRDGGRVPLPRGSKNDLDGIQRVAKATRREAALALAQLTAAPPQEGEEPMLRLEGEPGFRVVVITSWERFALHGAEDDRHAGPRAVAEGQLAGAEQARSAAAIRAARYRRNKKLRDGVTRDVTDRDASRDGASDPSRDGERDADTAVTPRDASPFGERDAGGERGGVHAVQSEETDREEEIQNTHSARAMASLEELGGLLRETALQSLAENENALRLVLGGYHMAHADGATVGVARQAIARLLAREGVRLQGAPVDVLAERLGTYLTDPRLRRRSEAPGVTALPQAVHEALVIFGNEWQRAKRRPFVPADGDEQRAARLVAAAERVCAAHRELRPLEVVRRWAREYLRDQDPYVATREHPLALLLQRLTSYGLPRPKAPPREPSAPEPHEPYSPPPELDSFGTGGTGRVPPRRGGS